MYYERLNVVLLKRNLPQICDIRKDLVKKGLSDWLFSHHTHVFDLLDKKVGVKTSGVVGARLALHEYYLAHPPNKHYHWLGYDACCQCGCGEHSRM